MKMLACKWFLTLAVAISTALTPAFGASRIKDVASLQAGRDNQLIGYGLVMGLQGTGDTLRNSQFTEQSLQSMLDRMGVNVRDINLRTRNVAAVIVTADLPPFVGAGSRIDVTVTSMGDATSLKGGTLMLTALQGGDGQVYAVAQGGISVSGFAAEGDAESISQGTVTTGRIPNGALVEQVVPGRFDSTGPIVLELRNPDFGTVVAIARAINDYTSARYGMRTAQEENSRQVTVFKPSELSSAGFVAEIGALRVVPDTPAKVVIDELVDTLSADRGFLFLSRPWPDSEDPGGQEPANVESLRVVGLPTEGRQEQKLDLVAARNGRGVDIDARDYDAALIEDLFALGEVEEMEEGAFASANATFYGGRAVLAAPLIMRRQRVGIQLCITPPAHPSSRVCGGRSEGAEAAIMRLPIHSATDTVTAFPSIR